jgi:penicillin-binding protein 1C
MHERVRIDRRNGLRAGPACSDDVIEMRTVERYPSMYSTWAEGASRPLTPLKSSPFCPDDDHANMTGQIRIAYPPDGARFFLDTALSSREAIHVRVDVPRSSRDVRIFVDGRVYSVSAPEWSYSMPLVKGKHEVFAQVDGERSETVTYEVQ